MNVHRLLALSSSAVIAAACSSGGSSSAPHSAATNPASTSSSKHAANATLHITFPQHLIRRAAAASSTKRKAKFVDPSYSSNVLEVLVEPENAPAYMAVEDYPLGTAGNNASGVDIPIYLAPGYDNVAIQEYSGNIYAGIDQYGYLLAQGDTSSTGATYVSENGGANIAVAMTIVLGDNFSASPIIETTNLSTYSVNQTLSFQTTTVQECVNPGSSIYFLPIDESGVSAYNSSSPDGSGGVPLPNITAQSIQNAYTTSPYGSSYLVPNGFGGYKPIFDSNEDPLLIRATYPDGVLAAPTNSSGLQGYTPGEYGLSLSPGQNIQEVSPSTTLMFPGGDEGQVSSPVTSVAMTICESGGP